MKIIIDAVHDGNGNIISAGIEAKNIQSKQDADAAIRYLQDIRDKLNMTEFMMINTLKSAEKAGSAMREIIKKVYEIKDKI